MQEKETAVSLAVGVNYVPLPAMNSEKKYLQSNRAMSKNSAINIFKLFKLGVFITACVKPTQTSATNNFKKQQCFFETFNNFWIFFFLQKEVSETTFCRKNNFNKVSRSFKKQLFAEKTILQSFKKFQKQLWTSKTT